MVPPCNVVGAHRRSEAETVCRRLVMCSLPVFSRHLSQKIRSKGQRQDKSSLLTNSQIKQKNRTISTWLTEAAFFHPP
jgi:hypothetical protein